LKRQGIDEKEIKLVRGAAIRYFGQLHNIDITLPEVGVDDPLTEEAVKSLVNGFHQRHEDLFGRSDPSMPVTIETVKLHAVSKRRSFEIAKEPLGPEDSSSALKRRRQVCFEGTKGFIETPCYDGERLRHGNLIKGPAIIEGTKTTVVIPPEYLLRVDVYGNYVMRRC
jgi:N-methylhydantoinase A